MIFYGKDHDGLKLILTCHEILPGFNSVQIIFYGL